MKPPDSKPAEYLAIMGFDQFTHKRVVLPILLPRVVSPKISLPQICTNNDVFDSLPKPT